MSFNILGARLKLVVGPKGGRSLPGFGPLQLAGWTGWLVAAAAADCSTGGGRLQYPRAAAADGSMAAADSSNGDNGSQQYTVASEVACGNTADGVSQHPRRPVVASAAAGGNTGDNGS
jgi:hypothetical protein